MDDFKDEPGWIVEQMLRRKREELARTWEMREKKLEQIRQKEKALEVRSTKRRRFDDGPSMSRPRDLADDDDEWLLDEPDGFGAADDADAMSGLSKETKDILARFGLGSLKAEQEEDKVEDGVKVRKAPDAVEHIGNMESVRYTTRQERTPNSHNSSLNCDGPRFLRLSRRRSCHTRVKKTILPKSQSSTYRCHLVKSFASIHPWHAWARCPQSMTAVRNSRSQRLRTSAPILSKKTT